MGLWGLWAMVRWGHGDRQRLLDVGEVRGGCPGSSIPDPRAPVSPLPLSPLGAPSAGQGSRHPHAKGLLVPHPGVEPGTSGSGVIEGVAAPRAHRVRTVATIGGQTPVHHPKMQPPKQPTKP